MNVKTYPMKVEDGRVYAEVTSRDVIEKTDVDELPLLAELERLFERLYRENDVLVRVLHEVRDEAVLAYRCLQSDVEHVVDSESHFFDRWWHAECECDRLKREIAELREHGMKVDGETSDGYHTFNELYHHRAVLFSVIVRDHFESAWKSKFHHDGTMYDGMFIVGINTPEGQATYHYDVDPYWEMFECRELERAPEWDGHTPDQAIERLAKMGYAGVLSDAPECGHGGPGGVQAGVQTADGGTLEPPMPTPQLGA